MLEVDIILNGGGFGFRRVIQRIALWNVSEFADTSDYGYAISHPTPIGESTVAVPEGKELARNPDICFAHGDIVGHKRSDGALVLLDKLLQHVLHEEYRGL